ncbi:hypothetical protein VUR80DRAFT_605 [Thermomyces stellatus]
MMRKLRQECKLGSSLSLTEGSLSEKAAARSTFSQTGPPRASPKTAIGVFLFGGGPAATKPQRKVCPELVYMTMYHHQASTSYIGEVTRGRRGPDIIG